MAERMIGPTSRQTLLSIAHGYSKLARIAAARERAEAAERVEEG